MNYTHDLNVSANLSKFDREYLNDDVDDKLLILNMYYSVFGNGYIPPHPQRKFRIKRFYNGQTGTVKNRGIEWNLTFKQWLKIWADSGRLAERGNRRGKYIMCRIDEPGPYSVENVYIGTHKDNSADRKRNVAKAFTV